MCVVALLAFSFMGSMSSRTADEANRPASRPTVAAAQSPAPTPTKALTAAEKAKKEKEDREYRARREKDVAAENARAKQEYEQQFMHVPAGTILTDYKANEVAADARYKGRKVQITGIVSDIKKDLTNSIYVTVGTGAEFEIPLVQAMLGDEWTPKAASLRKGQRITIRGTVEGLMINVLVTKSEIVG